MKNTSLAKKGVVYFLLALLSGTSVGDDRQCREIPATIGAAIRQLDTCFDDSDKDSLRQLKRAQLRDFLPSYGLKIRNDWELWRTSELTTQFAANGIYRDYDITFLILDIYWKHLNELPLDMQDSVSELVKEYDELASRIESRDIKIGDESNLIPLPDPDRVVDKVIKLPEGRPNPIGKSCD